jgi:glyoxylase-like metal-dependent hydrolase (beta-lactamase superfamily II)/rhodanese-related sulfurtransferase
VSPIEFDDSDVGRRGVRTVSFEAVGLGDRTYLLHDDAVAIVVDPQRDPAPYLETVATLGIRISHVFETHIHNDYVSGGLELARHAGAIYVLPAGERIEFDEEALTMADGDALVTGTIRIQAIDTPGHTDHHLAYLVESTNESSGSAGYVCTGGSLLVGTSGRTDLLGADRARELARAQWKSVNQLLELLREDIVVLPTHGFGSFCSATPVQAIEASQATIGIERTRNPAALRLEEDFVESVTFLPPPIPAYYRYMAPLNRTGGRPLPAAPVGNVSIESAISLMEAGAAVIDLRTRRAFAQQHLLGTTNIELGSNLSTWVGWIIPFDAPYVLLADDDSDAEQARLLLARIGREQAAGWLPTSVLSDPGDVDSYQVANFSELASRVAALGPPLIIDVRHSFEWRAGHLSGARHVPLPEFARSCSSFPKDEEIWVHCEAGFRAAIAASILHASGRIPVLVDDLFVNAIAHGLATEIGDTRGLHGWVRSASSTFGRAVR